jgi:hypothetical protein
VCYLLLGLPRVHQLDWPPFICCLCPQFCWIGINHGTCVPINQRGTSRHVHWGVGNRGIPVWRLIIQHRLVEPTLLLCYGLEKKGSHKVRKEERRERRQTFRRLLLLSCLGEASSNGHVVFVAVRHFLCAAAPLVQPTDCTNKPQCKQQGRQHNNNKTH